MKLIEGFRRAIILFKNKTKLNINNALYLSRSRINIFSFIKNNVYHIEIMSENDTECNVSS